MTYKFTDANDMVGKRPRQIYFNEMHAAIQDLDARTSSGINVIDARGGHDPITAYPTGITVCKVTETASSGFPTLRGTLETVYLDENRNIQHFFAEAGDLNNPGITYYRQWINNNVVATWTKWKQVVTTDDIDIKVNNQTYTHNQIVPSDTWVINHGMGRFPAVTIVDSGGSMVVGEVTYNADSMVTVSFSAPFGGTAYLN